ncbi:MAG: GTP 3',8-cyclase MoaA [Ignavibacteriales bacterium UTCHB1]|nr:GTP 3',8-cyclase MoaA [Ignavibacteria bacterium]OQY77862.1 MAG: GTP 3',8-cyclase MoaA [Ignavibacteriales bacterium UTCHB1]
MILDKFERVHNYLRISLTDSCNFRCSYCMPDEQIVSMSSAQLMSPDEIEKISQIFINLGVNKIRLTGGEPLVRKDFAEISTRLSKLNTDLTITTNGFLVDKYLNIFKSSGIHSVNVSLDSLRPEVFKKLTKRDHFHNVWNNIALLLENDFRVKINVVALNGIIEDEIIDFIAETKSRPLHIRFIEFMPFTGNKWESGKVVTADQMLKMVTPIFDVIKLEDEPNATAKKYKVPGFEGTFAFITTMSNLFCGDCNRLRLTADGKLKNCLFGKDEIDLLGAFRNGEDIIPLIHKSASMKHREAGGQFPKSFHDTEADKIINRSMIGIGG